MNSAAGSSPENGLSVLSNTGYNEKALIRALFFYGNSFCFKPERFYWKSKRTSVCIRIRTHP